MEDLNTWTIYVENLKCGGCERTVRNLLMSLEGVAEVTVSSDDGKVEIHYQGDAGVEERARLKLHRAGYAPIGESNIKDKAMSYISCMKGKLAKE
ncbi:MAG: heavy-metal-associated domain-containing protein [Flavobacteriales bacterium]|nr:heavy-metal-associated domain-containing protein [Flavobacteriales bacterium]